MSNSPPDLLQLDLYHSHPQSRQRDPVVVARLKEVPLCVTERHPGDFVIAEQTMNLAECQESPCFSRYIADDPIHVECLSQLCEAALPCAGLDQFLSS